MISWAKENDSMFSALCDNEKFKKQFTLSLVDMINTIFDSNHISEVLDKYYETYNDAVSISLQRYYGSNIDTRGKSFYDNISKMKKFGSKRGSYVLQHIVDNFGISSEMATVTLSANDTSAGYIKLNTITPDLSSGAWSGDYFTAYPVTVTAVANDGYRFVGWEGSVESDETSMEVTLEKGGITLNAVFEPK
jgi:hypothetical protein